MTKIFQEDEVSTANLVEHFTDSGWIPTNVREEKIWFHTSTGIAFSVSVIDAKKFVRIGTYLPLDRKQPRQAKLDFEHRLNTDIFLPTFRLDDEDDLVITYFLPYEFGLIAGQLIAITNRFASMFNFIVETADHDDLIDFNGCADAEEDATDDPLKLPVGTLMN